MYNNSNSKPFGLPHKEEVYKKYIKKYYIIRPAGADSHVGRIKEIDPEKGKVTLNPYFGRKFDEKSGKNISDLINRDYDIFDDLTKIVFEPTTRKDILHNCDSNKEEKKDESSSPFGINYKMNIA